MPSQLLYNRKEEEHQLLERRKGMPSKEAYARRKKEDLNRIRHAVIIKPEFQNA